MQEEAARGLWALVWNTAHELPDVHLSHCEGATWCHFARVYTIYTIHKDHLWTKLSARIKEGFAFILCPLVCI